ncbi:helicase-exonuclease AddAB subunit AddB [Helicovermis profundi]|uniref:Helicase-exonuclease AddAB subunit AddB n=1 Tax=Helicovermis profundi TaxID=3065157 RepID=A0AAU9ELT5_9FIRM|nr:helicase-exonuclease AddAB subunit AddB [Clostridia bacterium S502]
MLRYFIGRSSSGKTDQIYKEVNKFINEKVNGKIVLIVPEQFTLESEMDLINNLDKEGLLNVEVISFTRLMERVFDELGKLDRTDINEIGKIMILKKLFNKSSSKLNVFGSIYKKRGFLDLFSSLIKEFKRAGISSNSLMEYTESSNNILLTSKLKDIALVFKEFETNMEDKYIDEEDKFNYFIEIIKESELIKNSYFYIDSFMGYTYQEIKIIEQLMKYSKNLTITFLLDEKIAEGSSNDLEVFSPSLKYFNMLSKIAKKNKVKESKKVFSYPIKDLEIGHIEKNMFKYPFKVFSGENNSVKIDVDLNYEEEIERLAIEVSNLVRNNGYRWRDFAVVSGHIEDYDIILKRVFDEYNIPYFIDDKRSITNSPIIKVILFALKSIQKYYRYEDMFKLIKTNYVGLTREEGELLENYALSYGIKGKRWLVDIESENNDNEIYESYKKIIVIPLMELEKNLANKNTVKNMTEAIYKYMSQINIFEKLSGTIDKLINDGKNDIANEYSQIWNILIDIFDQIVEINGDEKMELKDFIDMLESGFEEYKVGIIPPTIDKVTIAKIERIKSNNIKNLFVIGLNDGRIPVSRNDYGILIDDEKNELINTGLQLKSDLSSVENDEELAFYSLLSKTKERIFFSYSLSSNSGKALRPSIYLDKLLKIFPSIKVDDTIKRKNNKGKNYIIESEASFRYLTENLRMWIDGKDIDELWFSVYRWFYNKAEYREKLLNIIDGLFHKNQVKSIGKIGANDLYKLPLKANVSRIENFNRCPFSHFIDYGLKPKKREEYTVELPDIGIIFHESIEKFGRQVFSNQDVFIDLKENEAYSMIEKIIDDMARDYGKKVFDSSYKYKYLINKIKRVGRRAAWTIIKHVKEGDFFPKSYELKFGEGFNAIPSIIIELKTGEKLFLEGRIDRVDLLDNDGQMYVKIIDYKSGSKKFDLSDVINGIQIQLLIYMDAVLENPDYFRCEKLNPAGVFYFKIDDPLLNGEDIDISKIESEIYSSLKLDGLAISKVNIVNSIDRNLLNENKSKVVPVELKKDGTFSARSAVLDEEDFNKLIDYVKDKVIESASEITDGNIRIEPILTNNFKACEYCSYSAICQFDTRFEDNFYRRIKKYKKDEVIEIINRG